MTPDEAGRALLKTVRRPLCVDFAESVAHGPHKILTFGIPVTCPGYAYPPAFGRRRVE